MNILFNNARWIISFVLSLSICSPSFAFDVPQLFQLLTMRQQGQAQFTVTKYLEGLTKPIQSSGELSFQAPDKLTQRTLKPVFELLQLDGDNLLIETDKRKIRVVIKDHPQAQAFIGSIRGLLMGDVHSLEKNYQMKLLGEQNNWQLALTPQSAKMGTVVKYIHVEGVNDKIRQIEYVLASGDRTVMLINAAE